jgi:hypothetical protein
MTPHEVAKIWKWINCLGGDCAAKSSIETLKRMIASAQQEKMHCAQDHIRVWLAWSRVRAERLQFRVLADAG